MNKNTIVLLICVTILLGGCSLLNRPLNSDPIHPEHSPNTIQHTNTNIKTETGKNNIDNNITTGTTITNQNQNSSGGLVVSGTIGSRNTGSNYSGNYDN